MVTQNHKQTQNKRKEIKPTAKFRKKPIEIQVSVISSKDFIITASRTDVNNHSLGQGWAGEELDSTERLGRLIYFVGQV